MSDPSQEHGGPDAAGVAPHDFSSNGNACGPCPMTLAAVQGADASRYPDPCSTALRERLAAFHAVDPARIVIAASASEFIHRITAAVAQGGGRRVALPAHGYGDYARAASAWSFNIVRAPETLAEVDLAWSCDPSSPLGQTPTELPALIQEREVRELKEVRSTPLVIDCAYAPLRLTGDAALTRAQSDLVWQLWTPNKALGLTGVRAAYAIAPITSAASAASAANARTLRERIDALAPSWPLGAHGAALLDSWTRAETQWWLAESLHTLTAWKHAQHDLLGDATDWKLLPSDTNFFCVELGSSAVAEGVAVSTLVARLRAMGVKLRDCTTFGLPGHVRMAVLPPASQQVLALAIRKHA